MSKGDRKKAMDIFNESNPVFAKKTTFEGAFPSIEDVKILVKESGNGVYGGALSYTLSKSTASEYVNCSNPLCYRGGFSIGSMLREAIMHNQTHIEKSGICQGNEASPKGKRIYRKCLNFFTVVIDITYKGSRSE